MYVVHIIYDVTASSVKKKKKSSIQMGNKA